MKVKEIKREKRKFHLQLNHTWWWCCNQEESRFAMKRINRGCSKYSGINITSPSAPPVPPLDLTKVKVNEFIILAQNCIQSGDSSTPYPSRCHEEYLTILRHESLAFSMPRQLELENAMHCHTPTHPPPDTCFLSSQFLFAHVYSGGNKIPCHTPSVCRSLLVAPVKR